MKSKLFLSILCMFMLFSCADIRPLGDVNMISNRNIDKSMNYSVIANYVGGSNKELRKSRSKTIQDAVDATVRKHPGGEYLMNAKIYLVSGTYIAVEGDVYGNPTGKSHRGFSVGDNVTWKKMGAFHTGSIIALKNDKSCYIKANNGDMVEKIYDDITKINENQIIGGGNSTTKPTASIPQVETYKAGDKVKYTEPGLLKSKYDAVVLEIIDGKVMIEFTDRFGKIRKVNTSFANLAKVK